MSSAVDRLNLCEAVLGLIEKKRAETGDENLASGIERAVLELQMREIEAEILENPGAFEPWLVRRRPGSDRDGAEHDDPDDNAFEAMLDDLADDVLELEEDPEDAGKEG